MVIEVSDTNIDIAIRARPYTDREADALRHFFYTTEGDWMIKEFRRQDLLFDVDTETLRSNLEQNLSLMCEQLNEAATVDWEGACKRAFERLQAAGVEFWVCGSAALALRGLQIVPHDIDIMSSVSQIDRIREAYGGLLVEPFQRTEDWVTRGFGVVFDICRIDLALDPVADDTADEKHDFGSTAMRETEPLQWDGFQLRVPPVHYHRASNVARGRSDRVAEIDRYLAEHSIAR